jgi:hypothetical protein
MPANQYPCNGPQPLIVGTDTGFQVCDTGFVHRFATHACPSKAPRTVTCGVPSEGGSGTCSVDAQCTARPNGMCTPYDLQSGTPFGACQCVYGCGSDADCASGQICLCGEPVGQCVSASCTTDADCGAGLLCTMSTPLGTCPSGVPFACQTPNDSCGGNRDCSPQGSISACGYTNSRHQCVPSCAFGRPFLVRGTAQIAGTERRVDWRASGLDPIVDGLSLRQREALGRAWAGMAALEHASIAAFARFALQLLSVGAPASLIEQTHQAMRDETEHAKMCFALAGSYAARPIGPGALPVGDALADLSPEAILVTTIVEGCIGETVAAIEAAEALEHAQDPAVRHVLAKIAGDEKRHAELAWQYVRWATSQDEELRAVAANVFASAVAEARPRARAPEGESDDDLLAFGVVSEPFRREIRACVLLDVIAPCARALLVAPSGRPTVRGRADAGAVHPAPGYES